MPFLLPLYTGIVRYLKKKWRRKKLTDVSSGFKKGTQSGFSALCRLYSFHSFIQRHQRYFRKAFYIDKLYMVHIIEGKYRCHSFLFVNFLDIDWYAVIMYLN